MAPSNSQIDALLDRTQAGDLAAGVSLLESHRQRLRDLVRCRMRRALARHVDPSDIVQETLMVAANRLNVYVDSRPVPFYIWLRRLALDQLAKHVRRHLNTRRRRAPNDLQPIWSDDSVQFLAKTLVDSSPGPLGNAIASETVALILRAIKTLPERQAAVIELRYLEKLSVKETAAELQLSESNVKVIHFRAIRALRDALGDRGE